MSVGSGLLEEMRAYAVLSEVSWLRAKIVFGCWLALCWYMSFDCCAEAPVVSPESKSQRATRR